jgi:signal transduction histidine kinase
LTSCELWRTTAAHHAREDHLGREGNDPTLDELRREIEELRASRARLASASDADRRAFERALHDGVQQDLVGLAANLEVAAASLDDEPAAARRLLDDLRREARRALTEVQELAAAIFPSLLEAGGIVPELRAAADRAGIPVTLTVDVDGAFPAAAAAAIYFCAVDVFERAPAGTPVAVSVRRDEGTLAFEITAACDLGSERRAPHDRIEALGGLATITPRGGRTTVAGSVSLPR